MLQTFLTNKPLQTSRGLGTLEILSAKRLANVDTLVTDAKFKVTGVPFNYTL